MSKKDWAQVIAVMLVMFVLLGAGLIYNTWIRPELEIVKVTNLIERPLIIKEEVPVEVVIEKVISPGLVFESVDFVFTGAFGAEIAATQAGLLNQREYDYRGRKAIVGEVPGVPGKKAVAFFTGTRPSSAQEAIEHLKYYFPPRNGVSYELFTHGGIAGGCKDPLGHPDAPDMQPGDSLAAAGACSTNTARFQPVLDQGYIQVEVGDTFASLAEEITGDAGKGTELFEYNKFRLHLDSPEGIRVGIPLLTPLTWEPKSISSFGIPLGASVYVKGTNYRFPTQDPCIYVSEKMLTLRDQVLAEMEVPPLSQGVIDYRARNFEDARTEPVIFSGDWKEAAGSSWYGDPYICRHMQRMYHCAQGDMETYFVLYGVLEEWPALLQTKEPGSTSLVRAEVDVLIYRSSSDPPDRYRGPAFSVDAFLDDPDGVYAAIRSAYRGLEGADDSIPFGDLIHDQSAQFRNFNYKAAELVNQ